MCRRPWIEASVRLAGELGCSGSWLLVGLKVNAVHSRIEESGAQQGGVRMRVRVCVWFWGSSSSSSSSSRCSRPSTTSDEEQESAVVSKGQRRCNTVLPVGSVEKGDKWDQQHFAMSNDSIVTVECLMVQVVDVACTLSCGLVSQGVHE